MTRILRQHWFLALLVGAALVVVVRPAWLAWTAALDPRWVVAPALFLAALGLDGRSLVRTLLRPAPALWATAISYGLLPLAAWLCLPLLGVEDLRVGLMVMVSSPCTLASVVLWTRLAGGNEATALLVILMTTCGSWLLTTLWLNLATGHAAAVDQAAIMWGLIVVLVLPVGLGQLCRWAPVLAKAADRHKPALGVVGRGLIFVVLLKAVVDLRGRWDAAEESLAAAPLLVVLATCLGLHLLALGFGYWSGGLLGFAQAEQIAVAFGGSQKTLPVALYLYEAYYGNYPLAVLPMVFYHVGQLTVDTFIAEVWARRGRQVAARERA